MKTRILLTLIVSLATIFAVRVAGAQIYYIQPGTYGSDEERYYAAQHGQYRQDFYGGYNTGTYAGNYGFYRRLPQTSRFGSRSYIRRYDPYHRIEGSQRLMRFGGPEFYGF